MTHENVNQVASDLMTVDEMADYLRIGRTSAYELCRQSNFTPAIRIGRIIRIHRTRLMEWLENAKSA